MSGMVNSGLEQEARDFFRQMGEVLEVDFTDRVNEVVSSIRTCGSYQQSFDELLWAARLAWRNSERCIGRLGWQQLELLDFRQLLSTDEVFQGCVAHIQLATNEGKILPYVSVFPKDFKILNKQLLLYAGYQQEDGSVIGDPAQLEFTQYAMELGWQPPQNRGNHDLLPIVIQRRDDRPEWYELPSEVVLEVDIESEYFPWFAELGIRWFALPVVSDKILKAGGVHYGCAPFSGYYMGTEIGARNLTDTDRYNLIPLIAEKMGLEVKSRDRLWKDRALVEINAAVLYSFRKNGVRIVNHHEASKQFMQHIQREEEAGRTVVADWSWIVPPMSSSLCPVFHRYYSEETECPRYDDRAH